MTADGKSDARADSDVLGVRGSYSEDVRSVLIAVVKDCGDVRYACRVAGIGKSTFYDWRRRAERREEPYASLMAEVDHARAEVQRRRLKMIEAHGSADWRALSWLVSKQDPRHYGDKLELTRGEDDPSAAYEELDEDELLNEVAQDPRVVERVKKMLEGGGE